MGEEEIISAFKILDTSGNGYITEDDLRRLMTTMGEKMSDKEVDQMIQDAAGSSKIDYVKFVKSMNAKAYDDGKDE